MSNAAGMSRSAEMPKEENNKMAIVSAALKPLYESFKDFGVIKAFNDYIGDPTIENKLICKQTVNFAKKSISEGDNIQAQIIQTNFLTKMQNNILNTPQVG